MVELGNERALCTEGPDGRESAEGRGEVREERRPRDALEALHRPRRGHVELAHEVEEREHGDARQQDQRLRQANDGQQAQNGHEGLKIKREVWRASVACFRREGLGRKCNRADTQHLDRWD